MTTLAPNPHSPYADADPTTRHIFHSPVFFPQAKPGVLALTACEGLAVVPEQLIVTLPDAVLPEGLCPACVTVVRGGEPPKRPSSQCGDCGTSTWHGALCALCRQDKHEAWWPTRNEQSPARTHTPDRVHGDGSRTMTVKRACNGCATLLGDITEAEMDRAVAGLPALDFRAECAHCRPLVELEAEGCTTWHLTVRSYARIDHEIDQLGVFTKQYTAMVDGKVTTVGMRIGEKPGHLVARFGDWIVRHPDRGFTVHKAPAESSGTTS